MEMSNTAGPWKIFEGWGADKRRPVIVDSIPDVAGKFVGNCICYTASTNPDMDGNANLIAAAPDLLNACRAAFDSIMDHCAKTGDVIWIDPPHQLGFVHESVCERLRNVIAQAEGRAVEEIEG
jgi:hypothetical protein